MNVWHRTLQKDKNASLLLVQLQRVRGNQVETQKTPGWARKVEVCDTTIMMKGWCVWNGSNHTCVSQPAMSSLEEVLLLGKTGDVCIRICVHGGEPKRRVKMIR